MSGISIKLLAAKLFSTNISLAIVKKISQKYRNPHAAVIVNFHRFYDKDISFIQKGPSVQTHIKYFDRMLKLLKKRYHIISMDDLSLHLHENIPLKNDSVVITMDDGYKDNLSLALPVLSKYKIPATVYIATGFIGTNFRMPMDRVDYALRTTNLKSVQWDRLGTDIYNIEDSHGLRLLNSKIGNIIKKLPSSDIDKMISELYQLLEIKNNWTDRIMLDWQEVKKMHAENIDIGSHGVTHTSMTRLSHEEAKQELKESKSIIEQKTGYTPQHFAFPNGMKDDFNNELRMSARDLDYRTVASVARGVNIPAVTDPFDLRRIGLMGTPEQTLLYIERIFSRDCRLARVNKTS